MRRILAAALLGTLALTAHTEPTASEGELAAVAELGHINGVALACSLTNVVGRAKAIMVARVPKTRRFGEAFEDATSDAFRSQTASGKDCPAAAELAVQAEATDLKLGGIFPPAVPEVK